MGKLLYALGIGFYFYLISFASLFNRKAKAFKVGRKRLFQNLRKEVESNEGRYIWFHCASVGEFEQGRPIIEVFKQKHPKFKILITFFSPSGYEIRKNYPHADLIFYLPEDSSRNASEFLAIVNPVAAVFVKYEFWYFFIHELKTRRIPLLSVSAIFRENQIFFKPYGTFYRNTLKEVDHFFVQNQSSAQLLEKAGIHQVTVSGDTRFDRVKEIAMNKRDLVEIKDFLGKSHAVVAGSTWEQDIKVLAPLSKKFPDIKFIIAPHEIHEGSIKVVKEYFSDCCRLTEGIVNERQVLIIDTIGLLSSLYQYATYAYIGGAFGKGLHNILEAATFGVPVIFGDKNYKKFNEAVELQEKGGALPVLDHEALIKHIAFFEGNPDVRETVGYTCKSYVDQHVGATNVVMKYLDKVIESKL